MIKPIINVEDMTDFPDEYQLAIQKHGTVCAILVQYQSWRRGLIDNFEYTPKQLGEAIDYALSYMRCEYASGSYSEEKN